MSQGFQYVWDTEKAASNLRKHGVSFEEAQTVFSHPLAVIFFDEGHSTKDEDREIIIGFSNLDRVLLVAFTERSTDIRLISARETTPKERKDYEEYILFGPGR